MTDKIIKKYLPMTETAFYILLSLYKPTHGYGIILEVENLTNKRISLGSGTIYGTLSKMQADGIVAVYSNSERKTIYEITDLGKELINLEFKRLKELNSNAEALGGYFK
ncbi:DNA-binding transcriptional regulator, PadR family [Clostridium cavendishii DSM 21758]|uniref:DNA-binding transcriptional regulator, PadR family n=1 Tax=Clostridium cavendishii DSM 21758 TaxID=1121302 RepID=A0A1M6CVC1_9CLOT|nr:PadR family transcriptional regulator [Clostridium cavendishii]SHI64678.1 DNA-binding transcriptional regulator, PadR family [Clostridium cavendishii DSM 21758]